MLSRRRRGVRTELGILHGGRPKPIAEYEQCKCREANPEYRNENGPNSDLEILSRRGEIEPPKCERHEHAGVCEELGDGHDCSREFGSCCKFPLSNAENEGYECKTDDSSHDEFDDERVERNVSDLEPENH